MKIFNEMMSMNELDSISGGTYKEYVAISDAIAKRVEDINKNNPNFKNTTERLSREDTDSWLRTNLNIGVDFGIKVASKPLDFINSKAKYYSVETTSAGKSFSHQEVLNQIAAWKA